jgi:broad specificity phosphatase PhoE
MKIIIPLIMLLCLQQITMAQAPQGIAAKCTIYLVRHAEKDTGNNPPLTVAGQKRAGDLMRLLKDKNIQRIYATQYKRTQQTGDSMRIQLHIDTLIYKADTTGESIYNRIIAAGDGDKNILIIGHSNTVPKIIRKLGAADYPEKEIADTEFDNLFVITYKKGKVKVKVIKYGAASGVSAKMQ